MNALQSVFGSTKTPDDLAREDIVRQALELAARKLESQNHGPIYSRAMRRAAKLVREMKP